MLDVKIFKARMRAYQVANVEAAKLFPLFRDKLVKQKYIETIQDILIDLSSETGADSFVSTNNVLNAVPTMPLAEASLFIQSWARYWHDELTLKSAYKAFNVYKTVYFEEVGRKAYGVYYYRFFVERPEEQKSTGLFTCVSLQIHRVLDIKYSTEHKALYTSESPTDIIRWLSVALYNSNTTLIAIEQQ